MSSATTVEIEINNRKLDVEFKVEVQYDTKPISVEDSTEAKFDANILTAFDIIDIFVRGVKDTSEYYEDIGYFRANISS